MKFVTAWLSIVASGALLLLGTSLSAAEWSYNSTEGVIVHGTNGLVFSVNASGKKLTLTQLLSSDSSTLFLDDRIQDGYVISKTSQGLFSGCHRVKTIVLPSTLDQLAPLTFIDCPNLESIIFPPGSRICPDFNFMSKCPAVSRVEFSPSHPLLKTAEDGLVYGDKGKTVFLCPPAKKGSLLISKEVTRLGKGAFLDCVNLTNVMMGSGVATIGDYAFSNCSGIRRMTIPEGVQTLSGTFNGCSKLEEIVLPQSLRELDIGVFRDCVSLEKIKLPPKLETIGYTVFWGCTNLREIKLPRGLKTIRRGAFSQCESLRLLDIPKSVVSLDANAFDQKREENRPAPPAPPARRPVTPSSIMLSSDGTVLLSCPEDFSGVYTIPNTVNEIADGAFRNCGDMVEVIIPATVEKIGRQAFSHCFLLRSVKLPSGLRNIPEGCFEGCTLLREIEIPPKTQSIGADAFQYCMSLRSIALPAGVESIGSSAFAWCTGLREVSIPESIKELGSGSFTHCSGLVRVSLPRSISSRSHQVFDSTVSISFSPDESK